VVESVDEMSMDVSRVLSLRGSSLTIAKGIMSSIPAEFGITCSIGVAPNRLLAKFASDLRKPSGLTVLGPSCFVRITETMPVKKLHGVGPKTSASLEAMGLDTIGRLRQVDRNILSAKFGKTGEFLWMSCRGIDPSGPDDDASGGGREKSIGKETTLAQDTADKSSLLPVLMELVEDVCTRLRRERLGARTVQLKVKYYDFRLVTRRTTLDEPTDLEERVYAAVKSLFERIDSRPIRLVGVALSSLAAEAGSDAQPLLFQEKEDAEKTKMKKIAAVTDRLKDRFGTDIVRRASTLPRNREEKPD
jgi:DNA polymerase-4